MSEEMTKAAAARIQSVTAKENDGKVAKDSFAARAQSAAAKNAAAAAAENITTPPTPKPKTKVHNGPSTTGEISGKKRGNNPPKK